MLLTLRHLSQSLFVLTQQACNLLFLLLVFCAIESSEMVQESVDIKQH